MRVNRLIQCLVLLSSLGLGGGEARAQPRLLIELHRFGAQRVGSVGESVTVEFVTEVTDHTTQTVFAGNYTDADVGMTFDAPIDLIDRFEIALTAPTGRFWLAGGGNTPVVADADLIWNPAIAYMPTAHVPRLGNGLTGYNLTRVSRTIDGLHYYFQPGPSGGLFVDIGQTISLYGELVPEPATISLMLFVLVCFAQRAARRPLLALRAAN